MGDLLVAVAHGQLFLYIYQEATEDLQVQHSRHTIHADYVTLSIIIYLLQHYIHMCIMCSVHGAYV